MCSECGWDQEYEIDESEDQYAMNPDSDPREDADNIQYD
jgi:hypothetical protein